ncbi:hypothetical protein MMC27_008126 [Xylographa pallens]|nr:hypothetical protein [Xylographa pallens]
MARPPGRNPIVVEKIKEGIWLVLGIILVGPFVLVYHCVQRHKRTKRSELLKRPALAELKHPRKRSLTIPIPLHILGGRQTCLQNKSLLFQRLPAELRWLIWKECLGTMKLHLDICHGRLCNIICGAPELEDSFVHRRCPPLDRSVVKSTSGSKLLLPLLTCRRIYSEAIHALYSCNTFDVANPECLVQLPKLILPQRLQAIAAIRFKWCIQTITFWKREDTLDVDGDLTVSAQVWRALASMEGLQNLLVEVVVRSPSYPAPWTAREASLLKPARAVTRPNRFELILPCNADPSSLKELPCKIRTQEPLSLEQ